MIINISSICINAYNFNGVNGLLHIRTDGIFHYGIDGLVHFTEFWLIIGYSGMLIFSLVCACSTKKEKKGYHLQAQIFAALNPIIESQNVISLFYENFFGTVNTTIISLGFLLNIAYLSRLPTLGWWLETHEIGAKEFCYLLIEKKGIWGMIKVFFKYEDATTMNEIFLEALRAA
ncbi:3613_t:CDS:2 [Cetraspora pellucida]|uniref:3613_t:CDS:1 n=1 Tax=Cetraspora pellucida TaxID=1433469 RepID=A0A9N8YU94_9GLOM|nr:3613_t:CDS:2 [Cetraspora pellucida]